MPMKIPPASQAAPAVTNKTRACVRVFVSFIHKLTITENPSPNAACVFVFVTLFLPPVVRAQSAARSADRPPTASRSSRPQGSSPELSSNDQALFDNLNRERTSQGLSVLTWDNNLAEAARLHVQRMADANTISHQLPGEPDMKTRITESGARFSMVAENVAVGANPATIHDGWMHSPGHRANILDPQLTTVGIATVRGSGGLFAVQDFSRAVASLSREEQEKKVSAELAALGLNVPDATKDARKDCDANAIMPGVQSASILRFETSDLSKLPDEIVKKIKSSPFKKAAVGACEVHDTPGFAHFRITLVLY
jgi:uncharacterized protein YkwD